MEIGREIVERLEIERRREGEERLRETQRWREKIEGEREGYIDIVLRKRERVREMGEGIEGGGRERERDEVIERGLKREKDIELELEGEREGVKRKQWRESKRGG